MPISASQCITVYHRTLPAANVTTTGAVYGWLAAGFLLTALVSLSVATSPALYEMLIGNKAVFLGLVVAQFIFVFAVSGVAVWMGSALAAPLFLVYSALHGLTLSGIFLICTGESVSSAFFTTAGAFGTMSVYGALAKRELTSLGSFCCMALVGVAIASLVGILIKANTNQFVISCAYLMAFIGLTAHSTAKLKGIRGGAAAAGALALYLDFINIFFVLLRPSDDRKP